ncbi:Bacteriophage coat protein B [Acinetobacter marinus]|uniref:Bacteriophage coat protein B n=1 Tax=Acinetobacter marinus TaxID=281375 RepID=A0A1G6HAY5_9GAMM|nr:major capsid protein [Acinetobacter marinus]SDB91449.1 Bacteriophage coat protein B [Acinetobacter marinus]
MDKKTQVTVHTAKEQKYPRLQRIVNKIGAGAVVATAGTSAFADYDVTEIVSNLGLAVTAAATIGVAWLGFTAGIAIWRNLRAAAR